MAVIWFHILPMLEDKGNLFIFLFWNKIYINICFVGQSFIISFSDCKHLDLFQDVLKWQVPHLPLYPGQILWYVIILDTLTTT